MKRLFKSLYISSSFTFLFFIAGCESPDYSVKTPEKDYADNYQVDLALLSEWAGNIVPIDNPVNVYSSFDVDFYTNYAYDAATQTYSNVEFKVLPDYPAEITLMNFYVADKKEKRLGTINCERVTPDCSQCNYNIFNDSDPHCPVSCYYANDMSMHHSEPDHISIYECHYYTSGGSNLERTWDELKREGVLQLRIGSGDSFGVSADVSARFSDIPTAIMLNAMNFSLDTFGNHSFDQSLNYLQTIIDTASYPYIGSNLKYVPQNLNHVAPYAIKEILQDDHTPLKMAFVSALDMDAASSVYPGRFGTLAVDDYCSVIHAIESAYNDGARAFYVQAHVSTDSDNLIALFNALFSFADPDYQHFSPYSIQNNSPADTCHSRITPSPEALNRVFGKNNLKDIDLSVQENVHKYNQLIQSIRAEIYEEIIGVFGEGGNSLLVPIIHKSANQHEVYASFKPDANDHADISFKDYLNTKNLLSKDSLLDKSSNIESCYDDALADGLYQLGLYCYDYNFKSIPTDTHPLWFVQLPTKATTTGQISVSIKHKACSDQNCSKDSFVATVDDFKQRPVMSSHFKNTFKDERTEETTPDLYTYRDKCQESLRTFSECLDYYNNATIINDINDLSISSPDKYQKLLNCFQQLQDHIKSSSESSSTRTIQNALECIYQPTSKCLVNDNRYEEKPFFRFANESLFLTTILEDRSGSTPRTSLAVDSILNYYQEIIDNTHFDGAIINAGSIRSRDLTQIHDSLLREFVPYNNYVVLLTMTPTALASTLQKAFFRKTDPSVSYGGFPSISGMNISKSTNPNIIHEIWLTEINRDKATVSVKDTEPVFIKVKFNSQSMLSKIASCAKEDTLDICIIPFLNDDSSYTLEADCPGGRCPIASYEINQSNESPAWYNVVATLNDGTVRKIDRMLLKLVYHDESGAFVPSLHDSGLNINEDGFEFILVKTDYPELKEPDLNILTLDYLTNGGDGYSLTYPGINIIHTYTDTDMRQIIHRYLSKSSEDICSSKGASATDSRTIDNLNANQLEELIRTPRLHEISSTNAQE